ncbi:MAG: DUF4388 domain-containing protein [Planctomycetota bacterium]|jgi:tetratricopeptide (TPR) repeat protein|nr:DUF4388 domain-containing protein [Planctomycetota bacterium]
MATTRRHRRHRSSGDLTIIELPDLLQSLGQSGRTGILEVNSGYNSARVYLQGGNIVALVTDEPVLLSALRWLGIATPESIAEAGIANAGSLTDSELAKRLLELDVIPDDGLRDAVDIHIEEGFTDLLSWTGVSFDFQTESSADAWGALQMELGTSIPPGGLLMEGLRRVDELKRVVDIVPARWDLLIREPGQIDTTRFDVNCQAVLRAWREGRPSGAVLQLSNLPPWQAAISVSALIEQGVFRLAEGQELVVYADKSRSGSQYRTAEGLYRRALERGAVVGRVHLALAELAERRGDEKQAAADYFSAATGVADNNPADAVLAFRSCMRLGGDREACLQGLLVIYNRLDEADDCCDVLFELATFYEELDRLDEAMTAVRDAQKHGADAIRCMQVLAALALMADDQAEAVVHLEQVIRTAEAEEGRGTDVTAARRQLLLLEPGRCELALRHAKSLEANAQADEALKVLRRALAADDVQATEDVLVRLREFLGKLDPSDSGNHEALAKAYSAREDRAGASSHLLALARSQEAAGKLEDLADTFEQILALGGDVADTQVRLARTLNQLGRDGGAVEAWRRAVAAGLEAGDLDQARLWADEAVIQYPNAVSLRELLAVVANRAADRVAAEAAYRAAAALALGTDDKDRAQRLLQQAHALCPEDLVLRMQLVDLIAAGGGTDVDAAIADFVRFLVRSENLGLALEWTRRRVACAAPPAMGARSELVELLRRMGRAQEELAAGRDLFGDLCEHGEYEAALEILQRLVASHSRNADLVLQLAELQEALSNEGDAVRFYRHATTLYQQEDRVDDAATCLGHIERLVPDDPEVIRARQQLEDGQAINWSAIRQERAVASKQRLADDTQSSISGAQRRIIRQGTSSFSRS